MEWEDGCCEVCGSEDHIDSDHEVISSADWGRGYALHCSPNMNDFALDEMAALGIDVNEVRLKRLAHYQFISIDGDSDEMDLEYEHDFLDKLESMLVENCYIPVSDSGDWTIYGEV